MAARGAAACGVGASYDAARAVATTVVQIADAAVPAAEVVRCLGQPSVVVLQDRTSRRQCRMEYPILCIEKRYSYSVSMYTPHQAGHPSCVYATYV